jgi:hypothetical protein
LIRPGISIRDVAGVTLAAIDLGSRPSDPEMDAIFAQLEAAGLLTIGLDAEGRETWTLTPEGAQVARRLAMGDEDTINAILDAVEGGTPKAWARGSQGTREADP